MESRFRRITESDIRLIINELSRWAKGDLGSKLTWKNIENSSGFSRQALQAKSEIKAAYLYAKQSLSGGIVKTKEKITVENENLRSQVEKQKLELRELKNREIMWRERWQRIAYNLRERGFQVHDIDKARPALKLDIPVKTVQKILKPFESEIPPTGRV